MIDQQPTMIEDNSLPEINYVNFDDFQEALVAFYEAAVELREEAKRQELFAAYDRAKHIR